MLNPEAYLRALHVQGEMVADAASHGSSEVVAGCPGWTVAEVVTHLGDVHRWAQTVVGTGQKVADMEESSVQPDELVAWYRQRRDALERALRDAGPDRAAWNFSRTGEPQTALWWYRRQALETAVHRWDVQTAHGSAEPLPDELAAAGVEEYLRVFLPRLLRRPVEGMDGTLHVHLTDVEGEWFLDLADPGGTLRAEHAKADTALRGPASGVYLWMYNRIGLDDAGIAAFGSESVLTAWPSAT